MTPEDLDNCLTDIYDTILALRLDFIEVPLKVLFSAVTFINPHSKALISICTNKLHSSVKISNAFYNDVIGEQSVTLKMKSVRRILIM